MFAALFLISLAGIAIFASLSALSAHLLGRWHESALERGRLDAAFARLAPLSTLRHAMPSSRYDVLGLGNAIIDVISRADDDFLIAQGLRKGGMTLIDEARAEQLYAAMGPATIVSGGSAANTIIGLASLGGEAPSSARSRPTNSAACSRMTSAPPRSAFRRRPPPPEPPARVALSLSRPTGSAP